MENIQQKMNELDHKLARKEIPLDEYYSLYHTLESDSPYYDYDDNYMVYQD